MDNATVGNVTLDNWIGQTVEVELRGESDDGATEVRRKLEGVDDKGVLLSYLTPHYSGKGYWVNWEFYPWRRIELIRPTKEEQETSSSASVS